jgi:uncharacterized RDD family membrane protein YckC
MKADTGARIFAFLIDSLIAFPIAMIGLIPFIGQFIATVCLVPYWLLRDLGGASIGKRLFGLLVVDYHGGAPSLGRRIRRNLLFGMAVLLLAMPVIGEVIAPLAFGLTCIWETFLIVTRGQRNGDRAVRCLVVKKTALLREGSVSNSPQYLEADGAEKNLKR